MTQSCASIRIYYDRLLSEYFFFCSAIDSKAVSIERKIGDWRWSINRYCPVSSIDVSRQLSDNRGSSVKIEFLFPSSILFPACSSIYIWYLTGSVRSGFISFSSELLESRFSRSGPPIWEYSRKCDIYRDRYPTQWCQVSGDLKYFLQKSVSRRIKE